MSETLNILSFGAGVQSTTVLHLAAEGTLGHLDHAIFADVGWEPANVYSHLETCRGVCEEHGIGFSVVRYRNLRDDIVEAADRQSRGEKGGMRASIMPPFYARTPGKKSVGMLRRFCTSNYKVDPVDKEITRLRREHAKARGAKLRRVNYPAVRLWLGISWDEIERCKHSNSPWLTYHHPLVDMRWTRQDCLDWFAQKQLPRPPRSACIGCPYKSNEEWRQLRDLDPEGWQDAVELDNYIRSRTNDDTTLFLHRSGEPLESAELGDSEGEAATGFTGECSGMCGL